MIKAVLFDLDGTLLPMDQDVFVGTFSGMLTKKMVKEKNYDAKLLGKGIWGAIGQMVINDGSKTNEDVFWDVYCGIMGHSDRQDENSFLDFYTNEFQQVAAVTKPDKRANEVIQLVKSKGLRPVIATNPLFPKVSTESRVRWAGLNKNDFEMITTFEDCHYCKPNLNYYTEILGKLGLKAEECAMVGNDVSEDMIAEKLGMKVFLLTDHIINKENKDISVYPNGGFDQLKEFIEKL